MEAARHDREHGACGIEDQANEDAEVGAMRGAHCGGQPRVFGAEGLEPLVRAPSRGSTGMSGIVRDRRRNLNGSKPELPRPLHPRTPAPRC